MRSIQSFAFIALTLFLSLNLVFGRVLHRQVLQEESEAAEAPEPAPEPRSRYPFLRDVTAAPIVGLDYLGTFGDYITIPSKPNSSFFYTVVPAQESTPDTPTLLWINGGPGQPSIDGGLIGPTGPYQGTFRNESDTFLYANDLSWNQKANVVYLDQPLFAGYSFSNDPLDETFNSTANAKDVYEFVVEFYKKHPDYASPNFYIYGISYGGSYVPPIALEIYNRNIGNDDIQIPLKGVIIACGLISPKHQQISQGEYLLEQGLITEEELDEANRADHILGDISDYVNNVLTTGLDNDDRAVLYPAVNYIGKARNQIKYIPTRNYNEIRIECPVGPEGTADCGATLFTDTFINGQEFRDYFNIKNNSANNWLYVNLTGSQAWTNYYGDILVDYSSEVEQLLEKDIPYFIFAGDKDYNVDHIGVENTVKDFDWYGKEQFNEQPKSNYTVYGEDAGEIMKYGPLTYVKVFGAGHDHSATQPAAQHILEMVNQFLYAQPIESVQ